MSNNYNNLMLSVYFLMLVAELIVETMQRWSGAES